MMTCKVVMMTRVHGCRNTRLSTLRGAVRRLSRREELYILLLILHALDERLNLST